MRDRVDPGSFRQKPYRSGPVNYGNSNNNVSAKERIGAERFGRAPGRSPGNINGILLGKERVGLHPARLPRRLLLLYGLAGATTTSGIRSTFTRGAAVLRSRLGTTTRCSRPTWRRTGAASTTSRPGTRGQATRIDGSGRLSTATTTYWGRVAAADRLRGDDIVQAFERADRRRGQLGSPRRDVAIYVDGNYSYTLNADDFYDMFMDATQNTKTTRYADHSGRDRSREGGRRLRAGYRSPRLRGSVGRSHTVDHFYELRYEGRDLVISKFGVSGD